MKHLNSYAFGFFSDVLSIATSRQKLGQILNVPLYSNALHLMAANVFSALCGYAFWIIAARFYPTDEVGLASAVIAAMGLLSSLANFGLGYGLIRFLPHAGVKANKLINSSFTITIIASLIIAVIFLGGLGFWSPALLFLLRDPALIVAFIIFTIAFTIKWTASEALVAKRRSSFVLAGEIIFNLLRLPLIILMAQAFHSFGIFGSYSISLWVALLFNIFLFLPRVQPGYRPRPTISREINGLLRFSSGNYLANLLKGLSGMVIPIMIINILGAESTAYYYIAWLVTNVLIMIIEAMSFSLFAEGSHEEQKLGLNVGRSLKMLFLILVPAVILVWIFADKILLIFGSSYSGSGTALLRLLTISTIPLAINNVYFSIKRVEKKLKVLVAATAFMAVISLVLSYVLLLRMGITGIGVAWLVSQGILALLIVAVFLKRQLTVK